MRVVEGEVLVDGARFDEVVKLIDDIIIGVELDEMGVECVTLEEADGMGLGELIDKLCAGDTVQDIALGDSDGMGFGETVQRVEIGVCVTLAVSDAAWLGEPDVKEMDVTLGVWEEDGLGGTVSGVGVLMKGVTISVELGGIFALGVINAENVSLGTSEELTELDGVYEGVGVENSEDVWLGE